MNLLSTCHSCGSCAAERRLENIFYDVYNKDFTPQMCFSGKYNSDNYWEDVLKLSALKCIEVKSQK